MSNTEESKTGGIFNYLNPDPIEAMRNTKRLYDSMDEYERDHGEHWSLDERVQFARIKRDLRVKFTTQLNAHFGTKKPVWDEKRDLMSFD